MSRSSKISSERLKGRSVSKAVLDELEGRTDKIPSVHPVMTPESNDFLLPENQLSIEVFPRQHQGNIKSLSFKNNPIYINSFYDEYSRNYLAVNIGKNLNDTVPLCKYDCDLLASQNILKHYNPGFSNWYSSFKRSPQENRHLLTGRAHTDYNLLLRVNNLIVKRPFEPIFATVCLYTILNDRIMRISESFHFDCTDQKIRQQYPDLYSPSKGRQSSKSVNVGDANGVDGYINKVKITIPEGIREKDIFLVVQVRKILTTTADLAIAPYKSSAVPSPDITKHRALCNRLIHFRQPLGIGISRISDENGKLEKDVINLTLNIYAQKACISDSNILQVRSARFDMHSVV